MDLCVSGGMGPSGVRMSSQTLRYTHTHVMAYPILSERRWQLQSIKLFVARSHFRALGLLEAIHKHFGFNTEDIPWFFGHTEE